MAKLSDAEILRDLKEKPTVPIDPHVAWAFDCSRNRAYQLAREDKEMFLPSVPLESVRCCAESVRSFASVSASRARYEVQVVA